MFDRLVLQPAQPHQHRQSELESQLYQSVGMVTAFALLIVLLIWVVSLFITISQFWALTLVGVGAVLILRVAYLFAFRVYVAVFLLSAGLGLLISGMATYLFGTAHSLWTLPVLFFVSGWSFEQGKYLRGAYFEPTRGSSIVSRLAGYLLNKEAQVVQDIHTQGMHALEKANPKDLSEAMSRALPVLEAQLEQTPKVSIERVMLLNELFGLYHRETRYQEALNVALEARDLVAKISGTRDANYASILNTLAMAHMSLIQYSPAVDCWEQALHILEAVDGADQIKFATYSQYGTFHEHMHDPKKAAELHEKALTFARDEEYCVCLNNLSQAYRQTDPEKSLELLQQAVELVEKGGRIQDQMLLHLYYSNLGQGYRDLNRLDEAVEAGRKAVALAIEHASSGSAHATCLHNLALSLDKRGDLEEAEAYLREAEQLKSSTFGEDHPTAMTSVDVLAWLLIRTGRVEEGVAKFEQIFEVTSERLHSGLGALDTGQRFLFLDRMRIESNSFLSLAASNVLCGTHKLVVRSVFERKGLSLDVEALIPSTTEEVGVYRREKMQDGLDVLRDIDISVPQIAELLPDGFVYIDYVRYSRVYPDAEEGKDYYAAIVVTHEGGSEFFDLGRAEVIDTQIAAYRDSLISGARSFRDTEVDDEALDAADRKELSFALFDALFARIESFLETASGYAGECAQGGVAPESEIQRIVVAPDSEISNLPLESLTDREGRLLLDRYVFEYRNSARDLLKRGVTGAVNDAVVLGDPDFDDSSGFKPLPGARREAETVAQLLGVQAKLGAAATKDLVVEVDAPDVLHIATHGYVMDRDPEASWNAEERYRSALQNSGVALAGAHLLKGEGLLTAYQLSSLNLQGTRLVVLSACETGLGTLHTGEGVLGLRRAVAITGAQSLLMSLWKIPDRETEELMTSFYRAFLAHGDPVNALHTAKVGLRDRYPHKPELWAGLVCMVCRGRPS